MYLLRGSLPYNIGALCKEVVTHLTDTWDQKRAIVRYSNLSAELSRSILGRLALKMQVDEISQFSTSYIDNILPMNVEGLAPMEILDEIAFSTGLIVPSSKTSWAFSHKYYQDFFCANYLMERVGGLSTELRAHSSDSIWTNVWRQVGQLCSDPEFFARSESRESGDLLHAIDRIVASLLAQNGLSKSEIFELIEGLVSILRNSQHEIFKLQPQSESGSLRLTKRSDATVDFSLLATIVIHLHYLRDSTCGSILKRALIPERHIGLAQLFSEVLNRPTKPLPKYGLNSMEIHFENFSS
jgi:hypothetical protein